MTQGHRSNPEGSRASALWAEFAPGRRSFAGRPHHDIRRGCAERISVRRSVRVQGCLAPRNWSARPRPSLDIAVVGVAVAIAAAWLARPELVVLDTLTGVTLIGVGLIAWSLRSRSRTGSLLAVSGFAWFLGSFFGGAVYLHRGPLAHMLMSYPGRRFAPSSRVELGAVITPTLRDLLPGGEQRVRHACVCCRPRCVDGTTIRHRWRSRTTSDDRLRSPVRRLSGRRSS